MASAQGTLGGAHGQSVCLAVVSARDVAHGRRALDRRNLPAWPDRPDPRPPDRARLTSDRPGRLPPDQMYPAGERGIAVRRVPVGAGVSLRVLEAGPRTGIPVAL